MSKNVFKLFLVSILVLSSCAPVRVEMPSYAGKTFPDVLSEMQSVSDVKTRFSIVFVDDGRERKGDAALDLAQNGDMSLRIYSLGFLATELSSKDGVVRSSPPIDPGKYFILTEGLRDCFFWWNMSDRSFADQDGRYILADARRTVFIDKKTYLPSRQEILFDNGREVDIYYDRPAREGDNWYQSRIRIDYGAYSATLSISHMEFQHR